MICFFSSNFVVFCMCVFSRIILLSTAEYEVPYCHNPGAGRTAKVDKYIKKILKRDSQFF